MGANQSQEQIKKNVVQKHFKQGQMLQNISCVDDLQCQNVNSKLSIQGETPIVVCPNAKCVYGSCECGADCKKDPYTGTCCKDIEISQSTDSRGNQSVNTFCIENFSNGGNVLHFGPF